jgi:hypothetical protein
METTPTDLKVTNKEKAMEKIKIESAQTQFAGNPTLLVRIPWESLGYGSLPDDILSVAHNLRDKLEEMTDIPRGTQVATWLQSAALLTPVEAHTSEQTAHMKKVALELINRYRGFLPALETTPPPTEEAEAPAPKKGGRKKAA